MASQSCGTCFKVGCERINPGSGVPCKPSDELRIARSKALFGLLPEQMVGMSEAIPGRSPEACGVCLKVGCDRQISYSPIVCLDYSRRGELRLCLGDAKFDEFDAVARVEPEALTAYLLEKSGIVPELIPGLIDCQNERPSLTAEHQRMIADAEKFWSYPPLPPGTEVVVGGAAIIMTENGIFQDGQRIDEPCSLEDEAMFTGGPLTTFENIESVGSSPVDPELAAVWNKYVAALEARRNKTAAAIMCTIDGATRVYVNADGEVEIEIVPARELYIDDEPDYLAAARDIARGS